MIAITGSSGFVGRALLARASEVGISVRAIPRQDYSEPSAFAGCDAVIHLAGLAHRNSATLADFMTINCEQAVACARAAASVGVKHFVYVSSSKALREFAESEEPLTESDLPSPACDYGKSKLAGESRLLELHDLGLVQISIVRPALVIGSPPKANLKALAKLAYWASKNILLQKMCNALFSVFYARKSYTSLENLCSALLFIAGKAIGQGEVFHVVDRPSLSTASLFQNLLMANEGGTQVALRTQDLASRKLFRVYESVVRLGFKALGLSHTYRALSLPFVLDGSKIERNLGWHPSPILFVEISRLMDDIKLRN